VKRLEDNNYHLTASTILFKQTEETALWLANSERCIC